MQSRLHPENASEQTYVQNCDEYDAKMSTHRGFWEGEVHYGKVGLLDRACFGDTCEIAVIAGHAGSDAHLVIEKVAVAPIEFGGASYRFGRNTTLIARELPRSIAVSMASR